jgi:hypothetical protein
MNPEHDIRKMGLFMRALTFIYLTIFAAFITWAVRADVLQNHDFETGELSDWTVLEDQLTVETSTNTTFNRNYAARMHGTYSGERWITNTLSQQITITGGDWLNCVGFYYWKTQSNESAQADSYIKLELQGPVSGAPKYITAPSEGWNFFELDAGLQGLGNAGFEYGDLTKWVSSADDLYIAVESNEVCSGDYALHMSGTWSNGWSFNHASQIVSLQAHDWLMAQVRINVKDLTLTATNTEAWVVAGIKLEGLQTNANYESTFAASITNTGWTNLWFPVQGLPADGRYAVRCMVCGDSKDGDVSCDVVFDDVEFYRWTVEANDGGFESFSESSPYPWQEDEMQSLAWEKNALLYYEGTNALRMHGSWTGAETNVFYQQNPFYVYMHSGDVVQISGRVYLDDLEAAAGTARAGLCFGTESNHLAHTAWVDQDAAEDQWMEVELVAEAAWDGDYQFGCMVYGNAGGGTALADIYFDDIRAKRRGDNPTGDVVDVTLKMSYYGTAGESSSQSSVDLYFDTLLLEGSSANPVNPTNIFNTLITDAAAIAAQPDEYDIPDIEYAPIYSYGYINNDTNNVQYPAHVELGMSGWRFRYFTNDAVITVTNTYEVYGLGGAGYGFIEIDQFMYCEKFWHTYRGDPLEIVTNTAPYFTMGADDESGSEFGESGFGAEHTYVVGTSLTNFPRYMDTDGTLGPRTLHIVWQENLSDFDRSCDKHFILDTVTTNGAASNVKALKMHFRCTEAGHTNLDYSSQELHLGWASQEESSGMVDYPNCTYQDHNQVALRSSWEYGMLDMNGWFMQQVPRGSATIEPIDLYMWEDGNWLPKIYEEYLFSWANAGSGVRSIFDDDTKDRLPGPASYCVGFKVGHQNGTNELGETKYPQVIEVRGNGYLRMTDYDGVMGGSFRPVSMDIFGIYQYKEDAPLMPAAYSRLVPQSTPDFDDSYIQTIMPVQSKTNQWLTGVCMMESHFAPEEVNDEGAYFEMETDVYANRAIDRDVDGPLNAFAQVDMYWRGSDAVDDGTEGHDFDAVMIKKADGEWVTHRPINPPTNIYHRSMSDFQSGDAVYIMQQDRGPGTYGFSTEAPYRKVSTFEMTMIEDGGLDLSLDLYEQNTISEINDNVVIACTINEDFDKGDHAHFKYRYRSIYSPGVTILNPNTPDGGENWSNNSYTIEFIATDGEDEALQANLYYGNGKDADWTLINDGELLLVPEATHKVAYDWDVSTVPAGAYYIKAEAQRIDGGKIGFDVSDNRLQVGSTMGFPNNGTTNITVVTNAFGELGTNMSFETGDIIGWASGADHLDIYATGLRSYAGLHSVRMTGNWAGWSWNNVQQEIPCISGEVLHVTGRVYVNQLDKANTNLWLACGIKMESTNSEGRTSSGVELHENITTGVWMNIDFTRTAPVDGTDRLLLWVAGTDCDGADLFFDDLHVMSTNHGNIVTNALRNGYWEGDAPVNVTAQDILSFEAAAPGNEPSALAWISDAGGQTNWVYLTNYLDRVGTLARRVEIPWSDFAGIDTTQIKSIGFEPSAALDIQHVRSCETPLRVHVDYIAPPQVNLEGTPHGNPGQDIIQVVTIENVSGSAINDVDIQLLQEYGETLMWMDCSPHVAPKESEKTRRGDRLCGDYETVWTNMDIAAGTSVTLSNTYTLPVGRLIDHTQFAIPSENDWYIFRNYAARAQLHLVVRDAAGDNLYDNNQVGSFSMDDDFDIDNDGLPDTWEIQYGGDYIIMEPGADPDGDGYDNLSEYLAGSDPTDPDSYPGHISEYTLHLAYTNGLDQFPQAVAEQSNYTGVASCWMIASYLNGVTFTQDQDTIFADNTSDPAHNNEITPQSCASWMYQHTGPGYYFSARYRTNVAEALKETVYWMDYLPPGGKKTPVYILCGTNWNYRVVRGFQTDRPPYDHGYGVTTASTYTVYGLWLNDPKMNGLGYDVYATAEEMESIYTAGTADGKYWLVAEPPEEADELAASEANMDRSTMQLAVAESHSGMASWLDGLFGAPATRSGGDADMPALEEVLPTALQTDQGFMTLFNTAESTNVYSVNPDIPGQQYYLAAGGLRGPGSTVYVLKLGTNGAMDQVTWDAEPCMYPPVSQEAAEWAARQHLGGEASATPALLDGGSNLLLNTGFETNTGGGGTADDWTHTVGSAGPEAWSARSGSWGMAVYGWGPDAAAFYQDLTEVPPGEYTFSVWMRKDTDFTAGNVQLRVYTIDEYGQTNSYSGETVYSRLDDTWQRFDFIYQVYSTKTRLRFAVEATGISAGGALKCDDVSVVKSTALLRNPGFEAYSDGWTRGEIMTANPESWAARSGSLGMAIASWKEDHGYCCQDVDVPESALYTFSAWMQKDTDFHADSVTLKLEWLDSSQGVIGSVSTNLYAQLDGAWQQFDVQGSAPANAVSVRCLVDATGITAGTGALKVDDLELLAESSSLVLLDADLVYDPQRDKSPFLPRWRLVFDQDGSMVTNEIIPGTVTLSGDQDGDGMSDGAELYAGTDPENGASVLWAMGQRGDTVRAGNVTIAWPSTAGRQYSVYSATDIKDGFIPVASHISATPPENTYTMELSSQRMYFKIEVE